MENLTKEKVEELLKIEQEYKKVITDQEKLKTDSLEKEKLEKIKSDILKSIAPDRKAVKFMPVEPKEKEEGVEYIKSFGQLLYMIKTGDPRVKTALSTTNAQGGYTIPAEWSRVILDAMNNVAQIPQLCTEISMSAPTLHASSLLTDLSVGWSTQATDKSTTKPTFSQADLTLRFLYALITRTNELAQDSISIDDTFLTNLVSTNMALALEAQILEGNANPFTGIGNAVGVNPVTMNGASISYTDLVNLVGNTGMLERFRMGGKLIMTRGALNLIMNLVDQHGRPLWNMNSPLSGIVPSILGYPYLISDKIADTLSADGTTSIYFGDLKNIWVGKKAGYENLDVLYTQTGVINSGANVTENALTQNLDIWRFEIRRGILVAIPSAFSKLVDAK